MASGDVAYDVPVAADVPGNYKKPELWQTFHKKQGLQNSYVICI